MKGGTVATRQTFQTTNTEEIKTLKKALAYTKIAFGKPTCKEFNPDCATCKGNQLIGYLEWYLGLLRWETDSKNQLKQSNQIGNNG